MSTPEQHRPVVFAHASTEVDGVYEPDKAAVGKRIERAREEAGFHNASEFARLIGSAPNTVYRYERGEQLPKVEYLVRIAEVTGRSMEWIMRGRSETARGALAAWRDTASDRGATEDELAWIERVDLEGMKPSMSFFDLMLSARRHGLSASEAIRAAAASQAERTS